MKKLYEFDAYKKDAKNEGKYIKTSFFLRKPNRSLYDEAELFYGIRLCEGVKEGLLTRAQLATKFADEIGTISQNDKQRYLDSFSNIQSKESEYQTLSLKKEEERSAEEKEKVQSLLNDIVNLRSVLQEIESNQQSLYEHTAETRARNQTVLWWLFNLLYLADGKLIFGEGDYKAKLAKYDIFEDEEDDFNILIIRKSLFLVTAWYTGKVDSKEEFDRLAKMVGLNENPEKPEKQEVINEPAKE